MSRITRMTRPSREQEGGFALLLVFVFAAAVAFAIYQELPRAAFESARDKEQLLMDRGKQYERAIEVYYAVNKRYPPELKDLEDTNQKRYLRRRYKDPLTGEDEWRLIHTNGSFLTDSLVKKPPAQNAANGTPGVTTVEGSPLGSNSMNTASVAAPSDPNAAPPAVNAAVQRRPSDRGFTAGGFPQPNNSANPFGANGANFDPADPRTYPPITLLTPSAQPTQPNALQPGQQPNVLVAPGQIGAGQPGTGQIPTGQFNPGQFNPGQFNPGQNNLGNNPGQIAFGPNNPGQQPFQPPNNLPFGLGQAVVNANGGTIIPAENPNQPTPVTPNPQNPFGPNPNPFTQNQVSANPGAQLFPQVNQQATAAFSPGGVNPGQQPQVGGVNAGAGGNPALQAINDQLFRPTQAAPPAAGTTGSPGIAGVASKHEGPSIKTYRERTKYQEWEFVFDPSTKNPNLANRNGNAQIPPGQNQPGQNQPGQNQPGQNPGQPGAPNPFSQPNPFSPQGATPANPPR